MNEAVICPVCKTDLGRDVPNFCHICGWDCGNDITLSLSLNKFSQAEREDYDSRLANAKQLWQKKKDEEKRLQKAKNEEQRKRKAVAAQCAALKPRINGAIRERKWTEALKLLDEYDQLKPGLKLVAEQRSKIEASQDIERKEYDERCSALKSSVNTLIQRRRWAEALKLLDEYDKFKSGDKWTENTRMKIRGLRDDDRRKHEARIGNLKSQIISYMQQGLWQEATKLLDEYDKLVHADSWAIEQRRQIQEFLDNKRREEDLRKARLKTSIGNHVQQHQWQEAQKLLDEYDRLITGDPWAEGQRKLIQDGMSFRPPPRPVSAPLPSHRPQTQSNAPKLRNKSSNWFGKAVGSFAKTVGYILMPIVGTIIFGGIMILILSLIRYLAGGL